MSVSLADISVYDALNQSVINTLINGYQILAKPDAYVDGVAGTGSPLVCKFISNTTFQLFSPDMTYFISKRTDPTFMFLKTGTPASFYFSVDAANKQTFPIDMTKVLWKDFNARDNYIMELTTQSVMFIGVVFKPYMTVGISIGAEYIPMYKAKIVFMSPNQRMRRWLAWTGDPVIKAGCNPSVYEGTDDDSVEYKLYCQQAGLYRAPPPPVIQPVIPPVVPTAPVVPPITSAPVVPPITSTSVVPPITSTPVVPPITSTPLIPPMTNTGSTSSNNLPTDQTSSSSTPIPDKTNDTSITILGVSIPWYLFLLLIAVVVVLLRRSSPQPQMMMPPPNPYYMQYRG